MNPSKAQAAHRRRTRAAVFPKPTTVAATPVAKPLPAAVVNAVRFRIHEITVDCATSFPESSKTRWQAEKAELEDFLKENNTTP